MYLFTNYAEVPTFFEEFDKPAKVLWINPLRNLAIFSKINFNENVLNSVKKLIIYSSSKDKFEKDFKKLKEFKNLEEIIYENSYFHYASDLGYYVKNASIISSTFSIY
jgi:hypothetical protein